MGSLCFRKIFEKIVKNLILVETNMPPPTTIAENCVLSAGAAVNRK